MPFAQTKTATAFVNTTRPRGRSGAFRADVEARRAGSRSDSPRRAADDRSTGTASTMSSLRDSSEEHSGAEEKAAHRGRRGRTFGEEQNKEDEGQTRTGDGAQPSRPGGAPTETNDLEESAPDETIFTFQQTAVEEARIRRWLQLLRVESDEPSQSEIIGRLRRIQEELSDLETIPQQVALQFVLLFAGLNTRLLTMVEPGIGLEQAANRSWEHVLVGDQTCAQVRDAIVARPVETRQNRIRRSMFVDRRRAILNPSEEN